MPIFGQEPFRKIFDNIHDSDEGFRFLGDEHVKSFGLGKFLGS